MQRSIDNLTDVTFTDEVQPGLLIANPIGNQDDGQTAHHQFDQQTHQDLDTGVQQLDNHSQKDDIKNALKQLAEAYSAKQRKKKIKSTEKPTVQNGPLVPEQPLQLQDVNQENPDDQVLYPPLGTAPTNNVQAQLPLKYELPANDYLNQHTQQNPELTQHSYLPGVEDVYNNQHLTLGHSYKLPEHYASGHSNFLPENYNGGHISLFHNTYLPAATSAPFKSSPDIHFEISDQDITGFETGGFSQHRHRYPGLHVIAKHEPLKIPVLGAYAPGHYNTVAFPPVKVNSLSAIGKYSGYRPSLEIKQAIGYEIKHRRLDRRSPIIYRG